MDYICKRIWKRGKSCVCTEGWVVNRKNSSMFLFKCQWLGVINEGVIGGWRDDTYDRVISFARLQE